MRNPSLSRYSLSISIFLLYLLPVFLYPFFNIDTLSMDEKWSTVSLGLLTSAIGTIILFLLMDHWQQQISKQNHIPHETPLVSSSPELPNPLPIETAPLPLPNEELIQCENQKTELLTEIDHKNEELQKLTREKNQLTMRLEKIGQELDNSKKQFVENSTDRDELKKEYLQTISKQSDLVAQQEQHILKLESQVRDLSYEIKTLVQVNNYNDSSSSTTLIPDDAPHLPPLAPKGQLPSPLYQPGLAKKQPIQPTPFSTKNVVSPLIEANLQLKRCVDIAQKMTGTSFLSTESSRFRDLSVNSYSIDLRCLFDSLRSEHANTILLYSQKEEKLLFANNQAKNLLGWSPEKFVQDFPSFIVDGNTEWKQGIIQLASKNETQFNLTMKTKSGDTVSVHCLLGVIPSGIFRSHVIGILHSIIK